MKLTKATAAKLAKQNKSLIAKHFDVTRQCIGQYIRDHYFPDKWILELSDLVGFEIKGTWQESKRERCIDCNCVKLIEGK